MDSEWTHICALLSSFLILSFLLIPTATSQESSLLYKLCTNSSKNYTHADPFAKNLTTVLDDLIHHAPKNDGFSTASSGPAYGLALCRGDVSPDYCNYCLYDARCKIKQRCNKRSAIVWYDYCFMKYSYYNFFGKIDKKNEVLMWNLNNAKDTKGFNKTVRDLLGHLSRKASRKTKLFAQGHKFEKKENVTIYGMAQCSRDLSSHKCKKCLTRAVKDLPGITNTTFPVGGRTLTASCMVRYETYVFLDDPPKKNEVVALKI